MTDPMTTAHKIQVVLCGIGILVFMRLIYTEIKEILREERCRRTKKSLEAVIEQDRRWNDAA